MSKYLFQETVNESILKIAKQMLIAAKTAPKARGIDCLEMLIVDAADINDLSKKMIEISELTNVEFFKRDANSILFAEVLVLIGTKINPIGLPKCGMCGFENCDAKKLLPNVPCVYNTGDLGIAIGSAVSIAMDHRVDNRVMFSAGQAALQLGFFNSEVKIAYGIPLSASSKNPFFDRK